MRNFKVELWGPRVLRGARPRSSTLHGCLLALDKDKRPESRLRCARPPQETEDHADRDPHPMNAGLAAHDVWILGDSSRFLHHRAPH